MTTVTLTALSSLTCAHIVVPTLLESHARRLPPTAVVTPCATTNPSAATADMDDIYVADYW